MFDISTIKLGLALSGCAFFLLDVSLWATFVIIVLLKKFWSLSSLQGTLLSKENAWNNEVKLFCYSSSY